MAGITGQDFQNTKWPNDRQSGIFNKFGLSIHTIMCLKKSQAILKCFIDLKSSLWFTLGSENETMFCDT